MMYFHQIFAPNEVQQLRDQLMQAQWADGRITAGHQGRQVKHNQQLPEDTPIARQWGERILAALERHPQFISSVLPDRVYPPLFNRYTEGMGFGAHVDNGLRLHPRTGQKFRTDLSATLFISAPETYDGGELVLATGPIPHRVKLAAGDLVVYPTTCIHEVTPVTRGVRLASFFWVQSLIRDPLQRQILHDLDRSVQQLQASHANAQSCLALTGCYHNLLRLWTEC